MSPSRPSPSSRASATIFISCLRARTAENWQAVVSQLAPLYPDRGLACIGAGAESERAERLASLWGGPTINLCGRMPPRVSAGVIERAALFLGHDSGPMHLAATAGVPIVAIFSARDRPGIWFPYQHGAELFYHDVPCAGCGLEVCVVNQKKCILSIRPDAVIAACRRKLDAANAMKPSMTG